MIRILFGNLLSGILMPRSGFEWTGIEVGKFEFQTLNPFALNIELQLLTGHSAK